MIGCIGILALIAPGVVVGLILHSWAWGISIAAALLAIVGGIILYRRQHRLTPEKWAVQLEKHLLGTEGPYDWKEATTRPFADPKLESLRVRIAQEFKALDTTEKKEAFRKIVEALKRGDVA
ncbi:MAG: hypothetical protein ABL995_04340 [Bryobacteraceae bacterium]